ncbi:MAG: protein kinase, partial [Cyanobacteria bacterium J06641_5]
MAATILKERYEIVREVGRGGFGRTFLALDGCVSPGRPCAIKQLQPVLAKPQQFEGVRDRFQREAAVLAQLSSGCPQIPHFYDRFAEAGNFYLVQEWIEGITLAERVEREGPLGPDTVARLLEDLLPVLTYLAQNRTIHRDIKPHNIILRRRDGRPVLIDFGAVKEVMTLSPDGRQPDTSTLVVGTPGYMAPEQAAGRPVYASDLYGLAMTALYLLMGRSPQDLPTHPRTGEILWQQELPHLHGPLADALAGALLFHPRDRFATAHEMLAVLQNKRSTSLPPTTTPPYRAAATATASTRAVLAPPPVNYWRSYLLAAIATIATAATVGFAIVRWTRAPIAENSSEPTTPTAEAPAASFPEPTFPATKPSDSDPPPDIIEAPDATETPSESARPEIVPDIFIDNDPAIAAAPPDSAAESIPELVVPTTPAAPATPAVEEPPVAVSTPAFDIIAFTPGTPAQEVRDRLGDPSQVRRAWQSPTLQKLHYTNAIPSVDLVFSEDQKTQKLRSTQAILSADTQPEVAEELLRQMLGGQLDPSLRNVLQ